MSGLHGCEAPCLAAPVLTAALSASSDGLNVVARITSISGELLALLIVPAGASLWDLQDQIWRMQDADVNSNPLWHYHPSADELYMSEPRIQFFDDEGHSVQLHAKLLGVKHQAQWPCMLQWLAWPGACCLHRPAAAEISQELPARLTMSRAPAGPEMQATLIKICELENNFRRSGNMVNMLLLHSIGDFIRARTQPLALGTLEALMCIHDANEVQDYGAATRAMKSLQRDVRDLMVRRCCAFRNDEPVPIERRNAFLARLDSIVCIYEEKHRRRIVDFKSLKAQLLLAFHKQPNDSFFPQ